VGAEIIVALIPVLATGVGAILWAIITGKFVSARKVEEARNQLNADYQQRIRDIEKNNDRDMHALQRDLDRALHENEKLSESARTAMDAVQTYRLAIQQNAVVADATRSVLEALQQPKLLGKRSSET